MTSNGAGAAVVGVGAGGAVVATVVGGELDDGAIVARVVVVDVTVAVVVVVAIERDVVPDARACEALLPHAELTIESTPSEIEARTAPRACTTPYPTNPCEVIGGRARW